MPSTITLYQFEVSPFCDKVRRAMHLKHLDYTTVEVLVSTQKAFKHISPTGKFPAIEHDGRLIVDSTRILHYLESIAPQPALIPADSRDRALATILEDWADESLFFYDLTLRSWPQNRELLLQDLLRYERPIWKPILMRILPGAIDKMTRMHGLGRKPHAVLSEELGWLYSALVDWLGDRDWLAGPRLSSADLSVFVMLNLLNRAREAKAAFESRPILMAWFSRVEAATAR